MPVAAAPALRLELSSIRIPAISGRVAPSPATVMPLRRVELATYVVYCGRGSVTLALIALPVPVLVTTKEALSRYAAKFPPQKVLRENTISAVKEVLDSDLSKIPLYEVATPIKLGFEFKSTAMADTVAQIPRMKRLSGTEVEIICDDMHELECGISAITGLAGTSN